MRGFISSEFIVYQQLFNPILSDSFGFTVMQTSYFFVLLLPATVGGVLMVWVSIYIPCRYLLAMIQARFQVAMLMVQPFTLCLVNAEEEAVT